MIVETTEDKKTATDVLKMAFDNCDLVDISKEINENYALDSEYINGKFYPPRPYSSWLIKNDKWVAPTEYPSDDNLYYWDEKNLQWMQYDKDFVLSLLTSE